jgi:hypothetical protein
MLRMNTRSDDEGRSLVAAEEASLRLLSRPRLTYSKHHPFLALTPCVFVIPWTLLYCTVQSLQFRAVTLAVTWIGIISVRGITSAV